MNSENELNVILLQNMIYKLKLFLFPQFKCYMKHCTFMFVAAILLLIIGPIIQV